MQHTFHIFFVAIIITVSSCTISAIGLPLHSTINRTLAFVLLDTNIQPCYFCEPVFIGAVCTWSVPIKRGFLQE